MKGVTPGPFGSPLARWVIAHGIGLNAFGLVWAATFVIGGLTHQSGAVAIIGFFLASSLGIAAGCRVNKAMKQG